MINQEIYDLMDRFGRTKLQSLKLSTQDYTIELTQGGAAPAAAGPSAPAPVPVCPAAPSEAAPAPDTEDPTVNAPLVGTFYARPAPDQPPFVSAGDRVEKGKTLCLIEAMKMMSEIPAPCDLVIEAVLKEDGELASFGEPLFRYRAV